MKTSQFEPIRANSNRLSLIVTFAIFSIFLISCSAEYIDPVYTPNDSLPEMNTPHFVPYEQALAELNSMLRDIDIQTRGGRSTRQISDCYLASDLSLTKSGDGKEEPAVYVFNFENDQGFAIISADDRTAPVLAVTDSGNLPQGAVVDHPGLAMFLQGAYAYMQGIINSEEENNDVITRGLSPEDQDAYDDYNGNEYTYHTAHSAWNNAYYGTLLATEWGQGNPYNKYCRKSNGNEAVVGCVAIAVAQLMAYYKHPSSYNGHAFVWTDMLDWTIAGQDMVAMLAKQVGLPQNLNIDYDYDEMGAGGWLDEVPRTFSNMGYTNGGTAKAYNFLELRTQLAANKPAIVAGYGIMIRYESVFGVITDTSHKDGHCWVVDGGLDRDRTITTYRNGTYYSHCIERQFLLHCNWALNRNNIDYNGYFLNEAFNMLAMPVTRATYTYGKEGYYNYNLQMVTGVVK